MFEIYTYDYILNQMLAKVSSSVDKREGSVIYDAIAPAAIELAQMYTSLDTILNETFADTMTGDYLDKRVAERGLEREAATYAVVKGIFNTAVPIGNRFNLDSYNYTVTELISDADHSYKLACETSGNEPNGYTGTLVPIDYVQGLTSAELTEILVPGEDEETDDDLRTRYFNSFGNQSFGGNRSDYKEKIDAIDGVGGCKAYRAAEGGGNVSIVIISSDYGVPSSTLVNTVQTAIDPVVNSGEGYGIAPFGHRVTVTAAGSTAINITCDITYASGWSADDAKSYIESILDAYFLELNKTWEDSTIVVRLSQIESRLIEFEGITDIENLKINDAAGNLVIDTNNIPVRGTVNGN
ncbi:MAG: baseplate J/gp47 family protein [Clostridia bacterium]|jgi:uncharacterized phage protein gp47/JayE|nr:baseplate J/gp47 family protein [Clostridia bacterium]MCI2014074.1 baseplate J/gp47 family protein [Clostridia bacterium]